MFDFVESRERSGTLRRYGALLLALFVHAGFLGTGVWVSRPKPRPVDDPLETIKIRTWPATNGRAAGGGEKTAPAKHPGGHTAPKVRAPREISKPVPIPPTPAPAAPHDSLDESSVEPDSGGSEGPNRGPGGGRPPGPGGPGQGSYDGIPAGGGPIYSAEGYAKPHLAFGACLGESIHIPESLNHIVNLVLVKFAVGVAGEVSQVSFLNHVPDPRIGQAISEGVRRCIWVPGTDPHGNAVAMWVVQPIRLQ